MVSDLNNNYFEALSNYGFISLLSSILLFKRWQTGEQMVNKKFISVMIGCVQKKKEKRKSFSHFPSCGSRWQMKREAERLKPHSVWVAWESSGLTRKTKLINGHCRDPSSLFFFFVKLHQRRAAESNGKKHLPPVYRRTCVRYNLKNIKSQWKYKGKSGTIKGQSRRAGQKRSRAFL